MPPFRAIFQVAATKEGSGVLLMKEPTGGAVFLVEVGESRTFPEYVSGGVGG